MDAATPYAARIRTPFAVLGIQGPKLLPVQGLTDETTGVPSGEAQSTELNPAANAAFGRSGVSR